MTKALYAQTGLLTLIREDKDAALSNFGAKTGT